MTKETKERNYTPGRKRRRKSQQWHLCNTQQPQCQFPNPLHYLNPETNASSSSSYSLSLHLSLALCFSPSEIGSEINYKMSSTPGNVKAILAGRRTTTKTKKRLGPTRGSCPKANNGGRKKLECSSKVVSAKLETLKNLIPNGKSCSADTVQADKLFQETADYILLLRTQVVVLQKLIEVYGSSSTEKEDNNVDAAVS